MATFDDLNPSQLLRSMGLMKPQETSYLPALSDVALPVAMLGVGVLLGASMALVLTPKTGPEMRKDLTRQVNKLGQAVRERIPSSITPNRVEQGVEQGLDVWGNEPSQA